MQRDFVAGRDGEAGEAARQVLAAEGHTAAAAPAAARRDQAVATTRTPRRRPSRRRSPRTRRLEGRPKRALERAQKLSALAVPDEPDEGSLTGSKLGTSNHEIGDQYIATSQGRPAAELQPSGRHERRPDSDAAEIRFRIAADGTLSDIKLTKTLRQSAGRRRVRERRAADAQGAAAAGGIEGPRPHRRMREVSPSVVSRPRVQKRDQDDHRWAGVLAASRSSPQRRARRAPRRRRATRTCRPSPSPAPASRCCGWRCRAPRATAGAAAVETMSKDMDVTGLFQVLDPASFPAQLQSEGLAFSSALWTQVGAQVVIKMKASGGALEGKAVRRRARRHADAGQEPTATPTSATPSTSSRTTSCSRPPASAASSARASRSR